MTGKVASQDHGVRGCRVLADLQVSLPITVAMLPAFLTGFYQTHHPHRCDKRPHEWFDSDIPGDYIHPFLAIISFRPGIQEQLMERTISVSLSRGQPFVRTFCSHAQALAELGRHDLFKEQNALAMLYI